MGKKPQTIEELKCWINEHKDDGTIKGDQIVFIDSSSEDLKDKIELTGAFVPRQIYNQVLVSAAATRRTKSSVGEMALSQFIGNSLTKPIFDSGTYALEFPFYVSEIIATSAKNTANRLGLTLSDALTYGLNEFIQDERVKAQTEDYLNNLMQTYDVSREYAVIKVLGWWRLRSRKARLEMSLASGKFVQRRKLPV